MKFDCSSQNVASSEWRSKDSANRAEFKIKSEEFWFWFPRCSLSPIHSIKIRKVFKDRSLWAGGWFFSTCKNNGFMTYLPNISLVHFGSFLVGGFPRDTEYREMTPNRTWMIHELFSTTKLHETFTNYLQHKDTEAQSDYSVYQGNGDFDSFFSTQRYGGTENLFLYSHIP